MTQPGAPGIERRRETVPRDLRDPARVFLGWELSVVFGIWALSDIGFYFVLPMLGVTPNYNDQPVAIMLYYLFWVGAAVVMFWPAYATWPRYAAWPTFQNRFKSLVLWFAGFSIMVYFAAKVLPGLPPFYWPALWGPTPELPLATPLYFLPKSAEILFQQLEVVAVVLLLAAHKLNFLKISLYCAAMFGGAHVLLMFSDVPWSYVIRFAVSASVFGLIFPYFILRVRNGFAFTYAIHWGYYAVTILLAREIGPGVLLNTLSP